MQFNNVENKKIKSTCGGEYFISRSVAVSVPVIALNKNNEAFVLVSRRGSGVPDFKGCMNLVCGYLDHNETLVEACKRELYEEVGLSYDSIKPENILYALDNKNWDIHSTPTGRQNVTVRYGVVLRYDSITEFPQLTNENCEPSEVDDIYWMRLKDALEMQEYTIKENPYEKNIWAFNHYDVIREWISFLNENGFDL